MMYPRFLPVLLLVCLCLAGCGDIDFDGIPDGEDNCPFVSNPGQQDSDGNGIGDTCQFVAKDTDRDGVDESVDNCRYVANPDQSDADGNGVGDACDDEMRAIIVQVLQEIAGDDTEGRLCLSEGNALGRERIVSRMESLGLAPAGSIPGSYEQPFYSGTNLIGIFEPEGMAGQPPQAVIGAHHDHIGQWSYYGCQSHPDAASDVCNGATDNAAGVGVVFAALRAIAPLLHAPVAVAFWDAEEFGKLGSAYFVEHPSFDTHGIRLYINMDVIGANLFIGAEDLTFAIGAESGGPALLEDLSAAAGVTTLTTTIFSTAMGQGRSDHDTLRALCPFVFFSDGTGPSYHTTADEIGRVNVDKVVEIARIVAELTELALGRPDAYPHSPVDPELPLFSDAGPVRDGLVLAASLADANGLNLETRIAIGVGIELMDGIITRGPSRFTVVDQYTIGGMALALLDISSKLPFIPAP
jgi:hypothetical protein